MRIPAAADGGQIDHAGPGRPRSCRGSRTSRSCRPPPPGRTASGARPSARRPSSSFARSWISRVMSVPAGPPSGGLYLKPPSGGGLCEGVTTIPSARGPVPGRVVGQDRPGDRRRRRVPAAGVGQHPHAVGGEHLQRAGLAGSESACVSAPRYSGPSMPVPGPVLADRLGGGEDVVLVERRGERRPAVPGRAERHPLRRLTGIGMHRVVGGDQLRDVDEVSRGSGLPGTRIGHTAILARRS